MLTEQDALKLVEKGLEFGPFHVSLKKDFPVSGPDTLRQRPDFILDVTLEQASRSFAVEYKSSAGLSSLRAAIMQARAMAYANARSGYLPMVVCPFLRPQALDELVAEKTSGLDLCGNGVIYVPDMWFAYKTGAKNRFPASAPIKSPYRGEQSIVARALIARQTFASQRDIVEYLAEFGIAPSTVSKALAALEEDLVVTKKPNISTVRPDIILDRLRDSYRQPTIRERWQINIQSPIYALQQMMRNTARAKAWSAVSSPERYAVLPSSTQSIRVLTTDIRALLEGLTYKLDERFPTFNVVEIDTRLPFFDSRLIDGVSYTSPLQEYLELANSGKREQEAAELIRRQLLSDSPL